MIVKTLLAMMGMRAIPDLHNPVVHDALNARAAALAGHARVVRLSAAADIAAASGDTGLVKAILNKQFEVRAGLDELTERLK